MHLQLALPISDSRPSNPKPSGFLAYLPEVRERGHAAFLGFAIGDALGATTEFMTPGEVERHYGVLREIVGGGWLRLPAGSVTDDTDMSLCVARSLAHRGWALDDIASRFAKWLKSRPRDVGGTCRRGIRRFMLEGTLSAPLCDADAGNGATMRMTPIALATLGDARLMREWGIAQAHLTHNHSLSDGGCRLFGELVQAAIVGRSKEQLRRCADALIEEYPSFNYRPYRNLCSAYVVDTMQTVLHYFFSTKTFEDCLVEVVNQGGDSDTAGAIVGAIAGAYYGLSGIPTRWRRALDPALREEIFSLSAALVDASPLVRHCSGSSEWVTVR